MSMFYLIYNYFILVHIILIYIVYNKATTVDGILHVRPLCTSGDVVLALHELLDVNIFSSGCIQLPSIVPTDFQRHTEGFYRYTYRLNQNGKWQYLM